MSFEPMDPFERALVASTRNDVPSGEAREKALQAMLAASVAGASVALTSAAAAGTLASGTKAAPLAAAAIVKWAIVASVGTAAIVAGVVAIPTRAATPSVSVAMTGTTQTSTPTGAHAYPPPQVAVAEPPPEPASVRVEDLPRAVLSTPKPVGPAAHAQVPQVPPVSRDPEPAADVLAREVAMLDRARAAFRGGEAPAALALLDAYDLSFPPLTNTARASTMTEEAAVLRIDATRQSGDETKARALAERFLETRPASPYAARVRGMLERMKEKTP